MKRYEANAIGNYDNDRDEDHDKNPERLLAVSH